MLLSYLASAQNVAFTNGQGEALIIQNDTVFIKLYNNDAFATYSVFYGNGKLLASKPKERAILRIETNLIRSSCADIRDERIGDSQTHIHVIRYDGTPVEYPTITITGEKEKRLFQGVATQDGSIIIDDEIARNGQEIIIDTMEGNCRLKTDFIPGHLYMIQFLVAFPYTEMHGKRQLKMAANDSSIVINHNGTEHILNRFDEGTPCSLADMLSLKDE